MTSHTTPAQSGRVRHTGPWPDHPSLLEINAATWMGRLRETRGGHPTLADIPEDDLDRIRDRGFDLVWLMGVWSKGAEGLALARDNPEAWPQYEHALPGWRPDDVVGSPFAIQDYAVNPDLGGEAGLAHLRHRLASRGIGLILDFVPNHTARDHPWIRTHPEYYVSGDPERVEREPDRYFLAHTDRGPRAIAHGKDPHFPGWIDTAQLNWANPALRRAMTLTLAHIATLCDGVRCDMVMLTLEDVFRGTWPEVEVDPASVGGDWARVAAHASVWPAAIDAARVVHPRFLLLAEVYWGLEGRVLELGFDYVYDKGLYDLVRGGDVPRARDLIRNHEPFLRRSAHFVENHDEDPAVSAFPGGRDRAAATLMATLPGLRFFHEGQFDGRRVRLPVQLGRAAPAKVSGFAIEFYDRLLEVIRDPVLRSGRFRVLDRVHGLDDEDHVIATLWEAGEGSPLVTVVNLGPRDQVVPLRVNLLPVRGRSVVLTDLLSRDPEPFTVAGSGDDLAGAGLPVPVDGGGGRILRLETRAVGDTGARKA